MRRRETNPEMSSGLSLSPGVSSTSGLEGEFTRKRTASDPPRSVFSVAGGSASVVAPERWRDSSAEACKYERSVTRGSDWSIGEVSCEITVETERESTEVSCRGGLTGGLEQPADEPRRVNSRNRTPPTPSFRVETCRGGGSRQETLRETGITTHNTDYTKRLVRQYGESYPPMVIKPSGVRGSLSPSPLPPLQSKPRGTGVASEYPPISSRTLDTFLGNA